MASRYETGLNAARERHMSTTWLLATGLLNINQAGTRFRPPNYHEYNAPKNQKHDGPRMLDGDLPHALVNGVDAAAWWLQRGG